jgi:hypothetical protein
MMGRETHQFVRCNTVRSRVNRALMTVHDAKSPANGGANPGRRPYWLEGNPNAATVVAAASPRLGSALQLTMSGPAEAPGGEKMILRFALGTGAGGFLCISRTKRPLLAYKAGWFADILQRFQRTNLWRLGFVAAAAK